jgi:hypothetical protein
MKGIWFARSETDLEIPLLAPLFSDLVACEEWLAKSDSQFARRTFVRASFAFHEAIIYWLKSLVIDGLASRALKSGNIEITKLMLLQDNSYRPNKRGKIDSDANRVPLLNFCAFTLRSAAECARVDPDPWFSDNGWEQFQIALKIRHRITHPKRAEDLDITDDEMGAVRESHRWLLNRLVAIRNSKCHSELRFAEQSGTVIAERLTLIFGPDTE